MDDLDEFALLTDDEVENMCKVVRKPGGTIENLNADVAGQPPAIPNPGIAVTLHAENNLKLACYFLWYKKRTSRMVTPADITLESVRGYHEYKKWELMQRIGPIPWMQLTSGSVAVLVSLIFRWLMLCDRQLKSRQMILWAVMQPSKRN
jgi:hypothetical protein